MSPRCSQTVSPELVATLAGWISGAGLVPRLSGRIDRIEARLAAVGTPTARIGGLLEGLGLTGRRQAGQPQPPVPPFID